MKDFIEGYTMFIDMYYYRRGIMNRYKRIKRYQRVGKETKTKKYGMPIFKNPQPPPRTPTLDMGRIIPAYTPMFPEYKRSMMFLDESIKEMEESFKAHTPQSSRMIDNELENEIKDFENKIHAIKDDEYLDRLNKLEAKLKDNGSMSVNKQEHYKRLKHLEDYLNKKGIHIPKLQSYSVFGTDRLINK